MHEFNLTISTFPGLNQSDLDNLEFELKKIIGSNELDLYRMMSYQLGWHDQNGENSNEPLPVRVLGQFVLSIANILFQNAELASAYAAPIELMHNFTLVHQDVEEGNSERNKRPTVWWTWGPAQAINAGDGIHAIARLACLKLIESGRTPEHISILLNSVDTAVLKSCEGEFLDIQFQDKPYLTTEEYLQMTRLRSGSFFGCAASMGALSNGKLGKISVEALNGYGEAIGVARQLAFDHNIFWGSGIKDNIQHGRLIAKKKNLGIAYTFEYGSPKMRRILGEIYMARMVDPSKIEDIKALLEEMEAREFIVKEIRTVLKQGMESLNEIGLNENQKAHLKILAEHLSGFKNGIV